MAAAADAAVTSQGNSVTIDVLGSDSDPDGNPLVLVSVTQGRLGGGRSG